MEETSAPCFPEKGPSKTKPRVISPIKQRNRASVSRSLHRHARFRSAPLALPMAARAATYATRTRAAIRTSWLDISVISMTQGPPVLQGPESRSRRRRWSFVSAHTAGCSCTASVSQPRRSRQFCRDRLLCVLRSLPVSDRVGGRLRTRSSGKPTHWLRSAFLVFFPELSLDALRGFLRKGSRLLAPRSVRS